MERNQSRSSVLLLIAALALFAAAVFFVWHSAARRCYSMAVSGRLEEALTLYREEVREDGLEEAVLRALIARGSGAVVKSCGSGKLSYGAAEGILTTLSTMEEPLNHAALAGEELKRLYGAQLAFGQAEAYEAEGKYLEAMNCYALVPEDSEQYKTAAGKVKEMEEAYRSSLIASAGVPETERDYEDAVKTLEEGLEVLPGDEGLLSALASLKTDFAAYVKKTIRPVAVQYISKGWYKEAIALLDKALTYHPSDAKLKQLRQDAVQAYEEFVHSQVNICAHNGNLKEARRIVNRALKDLPEDALLLALKEAVR